MAHSKTLRLALLMLLVLTVASQQGKAYRRDRRQLSRTDFYDTPSPLPTAKPGTLIRAKAFDDYDLPYGVNAVRILYYSRSAAGRNVAVSGVVLVPERSTPPGGWPVIAWAHGFTGVGRECAPSLKPNLSHGPLFSMWSHLGYAVVATDYAGLGTNFRSAGTDLPSNANDVIDSVAAARAAVPQLSGKWIAMGEAEGGAAALAVAESEHELHDAGFLGSVAISGVADLSSTLDMLANTPQRDDLLFSIYGVQTVYPEFQPGDVLTSRGLALYRELEKSCGGSLPERGEEDPALKPNWQSNKFVRDFLARNSLGKIPAHGPLLVLSTSTETASMTGSVVSRLCNLGDRVQFYKYAESDAGTIAGDSVRDQMGWIRDRFADKSPPSNCR